MAVVVVRNWTFEETNVLLEILKEQDIFRRMDQRKVRHSDLLKDVHQKFTDKGYSRSIEQMKKEGIEGILQQGQTSSGQEWCGSNQFSIL